MIFQKEYIKKICDGKKTQTRRARRGKYQEGKSYSIQECRTCRGSKDYRIVMDKIWLETGGICREDALAEGGYVPAEFEEVYFKIYHGRSSSRWVFKFHTVKIGDGKSDV